jgi:aminoglycoside phosphotransferase (APT) family kinase protein
VIVQQIASRDRAAILEQLTRDLPVLLAEAHIAAPQLLMADLRNEPPLLVREYIPGATANALLETADGARSLATQMGQMIVRLSTLAPPIWLDATWANPDSLAIAAANWLHVCADRISAEHQRVLQAMIAALATDWPLMSACLAHGDFCPVNAIEEAGQLVGLVDLEWARVATPIFDVAWWGWVVHHHHPERWHDSWQSLLDAAQITTTPALERHITAVQCLRCLELLYDAHISDRQYPAAMWAERLTETVDHASM